MFTRFLLAGAFCVLVSTAVAQTAPPATKANANACAVKGEIPCRDWCGKHRSATLATCLNNGCYKGQDACVPDKPK